MLYDGIQLLGSSAASNFTIESGSTLPVSGNNLGELFYKLNDGLYVYNGSAWEAVASNATISIGGSNTQIQFNNNGSFGASPSLTFDSGTGTLSSTLFSGSGASLTDLNGSNISSGTVGTARLGSGTANSTTYLRGDGTWATVSGASTSANNTWTAAQRGAVSALTYGATVTPNFDASNNFSLTATGNFTLANPTGTITPGQSGVIVITQDPTGSRAITSWGSFYVAAGGTKPVLSTAANTIDIISYYVVSSTKIYITGSLAIA